MYVIAVRGQLKMREPNGLAQFQEMMGSIRPVSLTNPENIIHGEIKFTRSSETAKIPDRKYPGDVGYDLYLSQDFHLGGNEVKDAYTGINISLPHGFWGMIVGRSSSLKDHGILVATGILDRGYTGPLHIQVQNLRNYDFHAKTGDRLAQFIIQSIYTFEWIETDVLPTTERSSRGFGSTGR